MTDTAGTTTPETETATGETQATTDTPVKETETVEFWKSKAREQEKRAKANADAASRLAMFEDAQKTEAQRLTEAVDRAESEAAAARAETLRYKIATQYAINSDDAETFLTGTDEDTLTRQAERLAVLARSVDSTSPAPRPDLSQGSRSAPANGDPAQVFAKFIGDQLNRA